MHSLYIGIGKLNYRFFLYSDGAIPVCFLNYLLKYRGLSYPTMEAISVTL